MSDVTGPISSLPGAVFSVKPGTMCDRHPETPAVKRVQGETDSMGSEMHDLCQACFRELNTAEREPARCSLCKTVALLRPWRDYEEGMSGPVYEICQICRDRVNAREAEELKDEWPDSDMDFDD